MSYLYADGEDKDWVERVVAQQSESTSDDLVAFLNARLDEREVRARRMLEAVWPEQVFITPADGESMGCLAVAEHAPKAYTRLWNPAAEVDAVEHGWNVHETAIEVWSKDLARDLLAEVEAKREVIRLAERAADYHETFMNGFGAAMEGALRLFALPYADHPSFREEWRV